VEFAQTLARSRRQRRCRRGPERQDTWLAFLNPGSGGALPAVCRCDGRGGLRGGERGSNRQCVYAIPPVGVEERAAIWKGARGPRSGTGQARARADGLAR
jgi:hypothetical protein